MQFIVIQVQYAVGIEPVTVVTLQDATGTTYKVLVST